MQRIAFFIPDLRGGGAERSVVNLLVGMPEKEYLLDLILVKARGVFLQELPSHVRVIDLDKTSTAAALLPLADYLRKNKPDVLISHLSHANIIALLARRVFSKRTKLILVEHALLSPDRLHSRRERWVLRLMKKLYPRQESIVAVSDGVARDLEAKLGLKAGKIRTIYNPIVGEDLPRKALLPSGHDWFGGPNDPPIFLGVGRLVSEKGFGLLLEAFARVRRKRPARLIILGEGEMRGELEKNIPMLEIGGDVSLPGFVENPYAYMARADAFVLSSRWEALPSVVIEALACGCPVIATDCPGGTAEILQNGGNGRHRAYGGELGENGRYGENGSGGEYGELVPVGDVEAMASAMLRVLDSLSAAGGVKGRDGVAEKEKLRRRAADFSVEKAVGAYRSLIASLIRNNMLTIVHVISGLRQGGAERMLCSLLSQIDSPGGGRFRHEVISLGEEESGVNGGDGRQGGIAGELRALGVPTHFLNLRPNGRFFGKGLWGVWRLFRLMRRIRPRVIQGWMYHGNLAASFVRPWLRGWPGLERHGKPPVVWGIHHSLTSLEKEKQMTRTLIGLGARFSGSADRILYVSEVSRRQHAALGYRDTRAVTIPNGVDTDRFKPAPEARIQLVNALGLPEEALLIGHVARYHPIKDHENFLRAAALVINESDAYFLLAGSGVTPDNRELTRLVNELGIADRVRFLGARDDVERVLAALDMFCLSSSGEALPLILLEAMACGIPCVTTDVGDAAEAVGNTGYVAAPRDPRALAAGLIKMAVGDEVGTAGAGGEGYGAGAANAVGAGGAERRKTLGKAARERVIAEYSLKKAAIKYEQLYEELAGNDPPGDK